MAAIFLDRDGVVTPQLRKDAYLLREDQVALDDGAGPALRRLADAGHDLYIFSNQKCVALGLVSLDEADRLMNLVVAMCGEAGAPIRDYRFCPHDDAAGCRCRKPKPGQILDLTLVHGIDLASAIVIGDAERDLEAGRRAGCGGGFYLIDGEKYRSLADVVDELLG
jgi:D-glycero-D-manno-heptose 1,7-bisphosphate phosphatase